MKRSIKEKINLMELAILQYAELEHRIKRNPSVADLTGSGIMNYCIIHTILGRNKITATEVINTGQESSFAKQAVLYRKLQQRDAVSSNFQRSLSAIEKNGTIKSINKIPIADKIIAQETAKEELPVFVPTIHTLTDEMLIAELKDRGYRIYKTQEVQY